MLFYNVQINSRTRTHCCAVVIMHPGVTYLNRERGSGLEMVIESRSALCSCCILRPPYSLSCFPTCCEHPDLHILGRFLQVDQRNEKCGESDSEDRHVTPRQRVRSRSLLGLQDYKPTTQKQAQCPIRHRLRYLRT